MKFDEKVELIYDGYTRTLDYETACLRADLTEKEREKADEHESLHLRIKLYDAEIREEWIEGLRDLAKSENENMRYRAIMSLGEIYYKKKFDRKNDDGEGGGDRPTKIILEGVTP
jgi:hypothetical protein